MSGVIPLPCEMDHNAMESFGPLQGLSAINSEDLMKFIDPDVFDGDTTDVANLCPVPQAHQGPPPKGDFSGDFQFEISMNGDNTHKKKYVYSHELNRIYVNISCNFSIQFKCAFNPGDKFRVRATTVFSDSGQAEKRVERCLNHSSLLCDLNRDYDEKMWGHVLRSSREPDSGGVHYCGNTGDKQSWYSVVVDFEAHESTLDYSHSHAYVFVCKNSCTSGINRRTIEIIFTLEDYSGQVVGRQTVGARVCSCPRRDMEKDERDYLKLGAPSGQKRMATSSPTSTLAPLNKKVKVEFEQPHLEYAVTEIDTNVYTVPSFQIVGKETLSTMLKLAENYMIADAQKLSPGILHYPAPYAEAVQNIQQLQYDFNNQSP